MQRPILTAVVAGAALLALTADSQANDTIRLGHAFSVPSATHAGEVLANTST